jgi:hypothetical protein
MHVECNSSDPASATHRSPDLRDRPVTCQMSRRGAPTRLVGMSLTATYRRRAPRPPVRKPDLGTVADHMRAHALTYMHENGPASPIGTWLWNLAARIEDDMPVPDNVLVLRPRRRR